MTFVIASCECRNCSTDAVSGSADDERIEEAAGTELRMEAKAAALA